MDSRLLHKGLHLNKEKADVFNISLCIDTSIVIQKSKIIKNIFSLSVLKKNLGIFKKEGG